VALDASRGTLLWRRVLVAESLGRDLVACADGRVHLEEEGFGVVALALDAASGRTLWSIDDENDEAHFGPAPEVSSGQVVSIRKARGGERQLVARDAASGRLLSRRPLPKSLAGAEIAAMRLVAGSLYAIVEERSRTRVVALDVATARMRWESAPIEAHTGLGQTWLGLDDDVVLACLPDGTLRAFEPKLGAIVWHHGLGQCGPIALARPDPAGPGIVLARAWSRDPSGADPLGKQRLLVIARGAAPPPLERATFEGAAAPGARVRVGTTVVTANASGRYRAVVEARGIVTVEGFLAGRKFPLESHVVELDGRRRYTADLQYIDSGP
jgi:outer membrane protein assembly factor BamB